METPTTIHIATPAERTAIESVLGADPGGSLRHRIGGRVLRDQRHLLLPALHAVNDHIGWLSPGAINLIANRLRVSHAEIHGVASFYGLFSLEERPARQVHVCIDLACRANGGPKEADLPEGAYASPCLGLCERAPAVVVVDSGVDMHHTAKGWVTTADVERWINSWERPGTEAPPEAAVPQAGDPNLKLLARAGRGDPLDLDAFLADGGFSALAKARMIGPEKIVAAVSASELTGRGGAAFPTGRKWEAVRTQIETPHYLVCNADESEPGTFKDRVLIENDPFTLIEAMQIGALATGATHGYIYLRGEYPRPLNYLSQALDLCRERGLLGDDFDITLMRGAGAYICGEETALLNSIEGKRGEPRNKPPFPFQVGLFGKPTVVNNVETLMNIPSIILHGHGTLHRLFCVSGSVVRPGIYECDMGITIRELIEMAGGMKPGSEVQAILLGGAAGAFAGPQDLDLVLEPEAVAAAGLTLGSGVVMVHDQHVDLLDQLIRITAFFRDESCGQCVPCRVGTVRQEEALHRLVEGRGDRTTDLELLNEIGRVLRDASICGLGQTAWNALESAIVRLEVFS